MASPDSPLLRFRLWYATLPPALRLLTTVNAVLYVAWLFARFFAPGRSLFVEQLALHPAAQSLVLHPWQVLTYGFVNLGATFWGFLSFLFSMLWLNWMGREYEEMYGGHRLYGVYILSTLVGGLAAVGFFLLSPAPDEAIRSIVLAGAFTPVLGVLCTVATMHPDRGVGLLFLGVVPLKWLALGVLTLDVLFGFGNPELPAHVGAAAFGFGFGLAQRRGVDLAAWARPLFERRPSPRPSRGARPTAAEPPSRFRRLFGEATTEERARPGDTVRPVRREERPRRGRADAAPADPGRTSQADVDRILDKILEDGYDALTDEEKRILDAASRS